MFNTNNMKDAWKGLNVLTGREKSKKECSLLNEEGAANRLNSFYARFDTVDFSKEHMERKQKLIDLIDSPILIDKSETSRMLNRISIKKATGPDKISAKIVKKCSDSLFYIIHQIFQISASCCRMPQLWKLGEIIPISKNTLAKVDNDLRPVTLTAILSKCFERVMLPKIFYYVMPKMDNLQFAYLPNRSTEDAINFFLHNVVTHLDNSKTYARCLFIDYSSAFNTMQPHILLDRLEEYGVPANLQLWILDFLTNRKQFVRTSNGNSTVLTINTGGPQGCVLSAFLFVIYTNAMNMNNSRCKIIKYADDTVVIGFIDKDNDESDYRNTIEYVSDWCKSNFLDLNVTKTKEIIVDFRKPGTRNVKEPVNIGGKEVEVVSHYKYLGCILQDNLKWDKHVKCQMKKANKRMYFVRSLSKVKVESKIISLFYNSVVSSVLLYAIACWYRCCLEKERKEIDVFRKKVCRLISPDFKDSIDNAKSVHKNRCLSLLNRIMKDSSHPLNHLFQYLPSGKRLNVWHNRTSRSRNTFVPTAINLFNM